MTAQVWLVMDEDEDYGDRGYVAAVVDSEEAAQAWVDAFWAEHERDDVDDDWCTCHGKARTFDGPFGVGSLADAPVLQYAPRQPIDDMADALGLRREVTMALLIRTAGYRAFGRDGHPIDADTMAALDEGRYGKCPNGQRVPEECDAGDPCRACERERPGDRA